MEIVGFPNYLIYPDGRVWGNKRKGRKEGFMKTTINHDGYRRLGLTNNIHKDKKFRVHRLVRWADRTIQNRNKGNYKSNTSGHRNVYLKKRKDPKKNNWQYKNTIYKISFIRINKIEVLCYKYIIKLRIKARHFH